MSTRPAADLKVAGERMSFSEADDALDCIGELLNAHVLNGVTHIHMIRWKLAEAQATITGLRAELDALKKAK